MRIEQFQLREQLTFNQYTVTSPRLIKNSYLQYKLKKQRAFLDREQFLRRKIAYEVANWNTNLTQKSHMTDMPFDVSMGSNMPLQTSPGQYERESPLSTQPMEHGSAHNRSKSTHDQLYA